MEENQMTITAYVEREVKRNELSRELVTELKKVSDDIEFIAGVLLDVENDEDKKALLEYIKAGIDVDFSQIILTALWLYQQREENTKENQKTQVVKFFNHRISKKFLGMTAAAVISCFGLFGVSMSTQGGRSYVMDKANEVLGDEKNTEIENSQDRLISDRTEEEARNEIEEKLQVEVPDFLYLPDKMDFDSYEIDETAQSVYIRYKQDENYVYFVIQANYVDKSGIYRNDEGDCLGMIESDLSDIEVELWKLQDEKGSTYLAQWDYKNSYYRISGRMTEDEMKKIIKDIMY